MHDARQSSIVRIVLQLVICLWFFIYRSVLALSSGVVDIPLIVRSPYLSAWQPVNGTSKSPIGWPTRPTPSEYEGVLGWAGYARVDGKAYRLFGDFPIATLNTEIANTSGIIITPTRTILTIPAGPITFNITFFSPIEPGDWVRQSIPFSYLYLDAISTDGESHSVQVYTDISAEWCSGNRDSPVNWTTLVDSDVRFGVFLTDPDVFNETQGQAEWGTTYYAMRIPDSNVTVTWESNSDVKNRDGFCANGTLTNSKDNPYGPIRDDFPVFAIAVDLQDITRTVDPVVWAIGLTREPAIAFIDLEGTQQNRSLYYKANYSSDDDLMSFFLGDFSGALSRADDLDTKIISAANSVSSEYSDILSLGLRQCLGATELTLGQNLDGTLNSTDVMMFMEDMGGVVHSRVNAVETLFEMFPMIMYIDPSLGRPILEPLFKFQNSSAYTHPFSSSDIGLTYPSANATTASSSISQALDQSANMIIMSYAYARTTGDGNQANSYYVLLKTWVDYLVNNTLYPSDQFSTDGIPITANQTNLALKGIIAIKAMSELSGALEVPEDRELYANKAADLYSQWKDLAVDSSTSILLATYGESSSWTLGDNIFVDLWLQTGLIEESILDAQTQLFSTLILGSESFEYGLPEDSSNLDRISSGWNLRAAAISTNQTIAQSLISTIRSRSLSSSIGVDFFSNVYNTTSGESFGASSPAQGALFSLLALNITTASSITTTNGHPAPNLPTSSQSPSPRHFGGIAGGVIAFVVLCCSALVVLFLRRRRLRENYVGATNSRLGHALRRLGLLAKHQTSRPSDELTPFRGEDDAVFRASRGDNHHRSTSQASSDNEVVINIGPKTMLTWTGRTDVQATPLTDKELARVRGLNATARNEGNEGNLDSGLGESLGLGQDVAQTALTDQVSNLNEEELDDGGMRDGIGSGAEQPTHRVIYEEMEARLRQDILEEMRMRTDFLEAPPSYATDVARSEHE